MKTPCLACSHPLLNAALSCPKCGHSRQPASPKATIPSCYACSLEATTLCQRCGIPSCVRHLKSGYMYIPRTTKTQVAIQCAPCTKKFRSLRRWFGIVVITTILGFALVVYFKS